MERYTRYFIDNTMSEMTVSSAYQDVTELFRQYSVKNKYSDSDIIKKISKELKIPINAVIMILDEGN